MAPASVVLVATEWAPSKGGVSSFNQELAAALARVGHGVQCVVDEATREEVEHARTLGVELHSLADRGIPSGSPFELPRPPDVVVVHGRWTGRYAARWRADYPHARVVHLAHVHPGQIDGLKTNAAIGEREARILATRDHASQADVFAAVGPLLADWWRSDLPDVSVVTFTPGLPHLLPARRRATPKHPRVLFVGRVEDAKLKGLDVAAAAMERVAGTRHDLEWVVRGVPDSDAFERSMRLSYPNGVVPRSRPFSASREDIADDLASAWLVIQPSLQEGFGLVTLEALRAGVPVLVGPNSGVARVLREVDRDRASRFVVENYDGGVWADAIERVLADLRDAEAQASTLASAIERAHTWAGAAAELVDGALATVTRPVAQRQRTIEDQLRDASQPLRRVIRRLPNGKWIKRDEETAIQRWLEHQDPNVEPVALLLGAPGTGKSALLGHLVEKAEEADVPVLGIKADLLPASVDSPDALRAHLRLDQQVIALLRAIVEVKGRALLVIDQLDALCEIVDAHTGRLNVLIQLIRKASEVDNLRVVASVRPFELRHEARLRSLQHSARTVDLLGLTRDDLVKALPGVDVPQVVAPDLCTPHALDLIQRVRDSAGTAFVFPSAIGELREAFWARAIAGRPEREAAARKLAAELGASGALWLAAHRDADLTALLDAGLLRSLDDGRIGFRHQTLFDLARARDLLETSTLAAFAAEHQQQLNVRPSLRSALAHLRARDRERFTKELADLCTRSDLALHLRLLLLDCLMDVDTPSMSDRRMFMKGVERDDTRRRALGLLGSKPNWIAVLDESIEPWLRDHPTESMMLAIGYAQAQPQPALDVLRRCWLPTADGARRCLDVLTSLNELGPEADSILKALVPTVVSSDGHGLFRLATAIARRDPARAAQFVLRCIDETTRRVAAGEESRTLPQAIDELLKLDTPSAPLLDHLETSYLRFISEPPNDWSVERNRHEESLGKLLATLLGTQATHEPRQLLAPLLGAAPEDLLPALERSGVSRWDDDGTVGDGRHVLRAIAMAGELDPAKVEALVRQLIAEGRKEEARRLLDALAKNGDDVEGVEQMVLDTLAPDDSPLDADIECASAFWSLARRGGLSKRAVSRICQRLAGAKVMAEPDRKRAAQRQRHAIFGVSLGGYAVPPGAYSWLAALMSYYEQRREADHSTWAEAVRAALRADHTATTWSVLLDRLDASWVWLAGEQSLPLLNEVEQAAPDPRMIAPLARANARARRQLGDDALRGFVDRLVERDARIPAAELTAIAATDTSCEWASALLSAWEGDERASEYAAGVVACIGHRLADVAQRPRCAELASVWLDALDPSDLGLIFCGNSDETWVPDAAGIKVLHALSTRVPEMGRDALDGVVAMLERFVDADAERVLEVVERALERALSLEDWRIQPIIAECLALSFSLRLALPREHSRVFAVFERALAADSVAATDALAVADGRPAPDSSILGMQLRHRRVRVRSQR